MLFSWIVKTAQKKRLVPRMSDTERQALEAGSVWLDGELFSGKPNFRRMLEAPYPTLTEAEQAFLDGPVEEVCALVDPWWVETHRELPPEVWRFLKEHRFFGLAIPPEHGGHGFSALAQSSIFAKLVTRSMYLSSVVLIPNSVGPGELLLEYGTEAQQRHYLPRLARGEEIPCFALTEPEAGSDAASLTSQGVVFRGNDGGLRLRLDWEKRYITLAPIATLIGLAVRLKDPENLLGRGEDLGITCVLVPADAPGVEIGSHHDPMGIPFPNGPLRGRGVEVSIDQIIGGTDYAGKGWRMLMEALSGGRAISLPAQATGGAKWIARVAGAYSGVRRQFGTPIGNFEGVEEPLARIAGRAYLMEAARVFTCGALASGERPSVVSALMKYNLTELSRQSAADGMDVLGGAAICRGPKNLMADAWIGSPIGITVEGANILTRTLITFGQGAIRCHPYLQKEMAALEAGEVGAFRGAFLRHLGFTVGNFLRATCLGLSRGRLARAPVTGATARYYRKLAWASARFALWTDITLALYGGKLKTRGKLTGRFADALSWMVLGMAALRRFEAEGRRPEDLPLVQWAAETSLARVQEAFEGIFRNYEAPLLGAFIRGPVAWWARVNPITPLGGTRGPGDRLGAQVAATVRVPGGLRDRLTNELYLNVGHQEALAVLERAFTLLHGVEPILRRITRAGRKGKIPRGNPFAQVDAALAAGVITADQATQVRRAHQAQQQAIQVDDFPFEAYARRGAPAPGEDTVPTVNAEVAGG
jgi:acyl-CoA dehydrogenase